MFPLDFNIFKSKIKLDKDETEFLPAVLEITETPPSPIGRFMIWTIISLVVIALIWMSLGQVDEVAVASGKTIPLGYVKEIQAEDKGIVKRILVQDGQQVRAGQLLVELDPTSSEADLTTIRKEIAYYNLQIERLLAEKTGRMYLPGPYPGIEAKDIDFQLKLYTSRQDAFKTRVTMAKNDIQQNQTNLANAKIDLAKLQALYEIAQEKEAKMEQLYQQGLIALFELLDYKEKRIELEQNLAAKNSQVSQAEGALTQSRETLKNTIAEWNLDIDTQLVDSRKQLLSLMESLKKAEEKHNLSKLVAPIDGKVNQLAVHTIGAIVTEAQPIMLIVPDNAKLIVEAWIDNKDIGFVRKGQSAIIKVETYNFQKYGTIEATLSDIGPDAVEDKDKGRVYRSLLYLKRDYIVIDGKKCYLGPGMSVTAEVKIGRRRIIEFFLDPFKKYQSEGLREK